MMKRQEKQLKPKDSGAKAWIEAHDTIVKLLANRSHYLHKWLNHVHADPDKHTIIQFPVPLSPLSSHYFLVEKSKVPMLTAAFGNGAIEAADYLSQCPNIVIEQSVAVSDPAHHYGEKKRAYLN